MNQSEHGEAKSWVTEWLEWEDILHMSKMGEPNKRSPKRAPSPDVAELATSSSPSPSSPSSSPSPTCSSYAHIHHKPSRIKLGADIEEEQAPWLKFRPPRASFR